jgi:hypothetical protein
MVALALLLILRARFKLRSEIPNSLAVRESFDRVWFSNRKDSVAAD